METELLKKLLWCYFEGRATPAQTLLLREALADPNNQKAYYDIIHEWELANPQVLPDTDSDWKKLADKINTDTSSQQEVPPLSSDRNTLTNTLKVAAAVIFLCALTAWNHEYLLFQRYHTGNGEVRKFTLADGSSVTLNANSELLFSRLFFFSRERKAILKGEAEFSVVHTKDNRQFLVQTPDSLEVKVLGTEFLVYTRREKSKVVLTSGSIELSSLKADLSPIRVSPGEVVDIDPGGVFNVVRNESPEMHFLWKEKRFNFNKTPLEEIARQVQDRFGVRIIIPDPSLAKLAITGQYPAETADEIISMLSTILNLKQRKIDHESILLQKI